MTQIDEELHARIHTAMMAVPPDAIFGRRVEVFPRVEKALGMQLHGRVLDVGCGNGYAGIWLARHRAVEEVVALEASPAAVDELIPRNVAHHGVGDRVGDGVFVESRAVGVLLVHAEHVDTAGHRKRGRSVRTW